MRAKITQRIKYNKEKVGGDVLTVIFTNILMLTTFLRPSIKATLCIGELHSVITGDNLKIITR